MSINVAPDGKVLLRCHVGCSFETVCDALELQPADLFAGPRERSTDGTQRDYVIRDIDGREIARHHRIDKAAGKKVMWWSRDGVKGLRGMRGTSLPLYGSELLKASSDELVVIAEGEKAADALRQRGILALGTVTGASSSPGAQVLEALRNRDVLLWPDNDHERQRHMIAIARTLGEIARSIRIIRWHDAPMGGDAADFDGNDSALRALIENAVDAEDASAATQERDAIQAEAAVSEGDAQDDDDGDPKAPLTDVTNAREFVSRDGADFRFARALGWLRWDDRRWAPCKRGEELQAAVGTMEALLAEGMAKLKQLARDLQVAEKAGDVDSVLKAMRAEEKQARRVVDHCVASQRLARLQAMLTIAATDPTLAIDANDLDRDPFLLNVRNGTVDLRTGQLREHRREDLLSHIAGACHLPSARRDLWLRTLGEVFAADDCEDVIAYVQRFAGYSATGSTREEVFHLLWGDGRNGKGVIVGTMMAALGDYAKTAPMSLFLESRGDGSKRFAIAEFRGVRMLVASEAAEGRAFDLAQLKAWTGGDQRYAERKGRDPFAYTPTDKPWLLVNDRPRVKSWDAAFEERLRLLPFEHSFTGDRADKNRKADLQAELDGVLTWIIEGTSAWLREGLRPPERVRGAVADYRSESVHADKFVAERVVRVLGASVLQSDVYAAYLAWSRQRGHEAASDRKFGAYLERAGFRREKRERGQVVRDALLRQDEDAKRAGPTADDPGDHDDTPTRSQNPKTRSPRGSESDPRQDRQHRQDAQPDDGPAVGRAHDRQHTIRFDNRVATRVPIGPRPSTHAELTFNLGRALPRRCIGAAKRAPIKHNLCCVAGVGQGGRRVAA